MRLAITAFAAMTCLLLSTADPAEGQVPGGVSVGFSNNCQNGIVVKGFTIVNGMQRSGQLMPMKKGGKAYESNVPSGIRYYTVQDLVTSRVLLKDHPVPVQNRDVLLNIVTSPLDPMRVIIMPATP